MQHHLVYLYLVCSHNGPCAKTGPTLRSHVLHRLIYETLKIVYSKTTEPRVYIWHAESIHYLVVLLSLLKIITLWQKMRPPRGSWFYI